MKMKLIRQFQGNFLNFTKYIYVLSFEFVSVIRGMAP